MNDIDFLPVQYRQQHERRQSTPWRILAVAAFVALVALALVSQHANYRKVEGELAAIMPQYEQAVSLDKQLGAVQADLQKEELEAELFTYLRHPWPRTQLLAALLVTLPDEITLRQLQITRETLLPRTPTERRSRSQRKAEEAELEGLSPAERDLKQLRDRFDNMQTLVSLSGITAESAALHQYLGELGNSDLFAKAELCSIESVEDNGAKTLQFEATLIVRPGYGLPGGQSGPDQKAVAEAD